MLLAGEIAPTVNGTPRKRGPRCVYGLKSRFESHPLLHALSIYNGFLDFLIFRVQMRVQG
jgi:hypothetical protein